MGTLSEDEAGALIEEHHVVRLDPFPAGMDFLLGDGSLLRFWDASEDYGREWELEA